MFALDPMILNRLRPAATQWFIGGMRDKLKKIRPISISLSCAARKLGRAINIISAGILCHGHDNRGLQELGELNGERY
jgi:hypothetical protein